MSGLAPSARRSHPLMNEDRQRRRLQTFHHPVAHVLDGVTALAGTFGGQQEFLQDALASQGAIGIRQSHLTAASHLALWPRLTFGCGTGANVAQQGNEALGVMWTLVTALPGWGLGREIGLG